MILESTNETTGLQSGDCCRYYVRDGTLAFLRGHIRLLTSNRDDKFLLQPKPISIIALTQYLRVIAETAGLTLKLDRQDTNAVWYIFR